MELHFIPLCLHCHPFLLDTEILHIWAKCSSKSGRNQYVIFYLYLMEIVQIIASWRWKEFTRLKESWQKVHCTPQKLYKLSLSTFTDNLYIYINEHDTSVLASPSLFPLSVDVSLLALPVPCVPIQFEYQMLCLISPLYYCLRKTASDSWCCQQTVYCFGV